MGSSNGNGPNEEPHEIAPLPMPLAWQIGASEVANMKYIVLQVQTPAGTNLYWLPVDSAIEFGRKVTQYAQSHKFGGLTIPAEGQVENILKNSKGFPLNGG